jgi:hypothetical protein
VPTHWSFLYRQRKIRSSSHRQHHVVSRFFVGASPGSLVLLGFMLSFKKPSSRRLHHTSSAFTPMSIDVRKQRTAAIAESDERLLAELGYKQEFQRAFTPLEVCYVITARINIPISSSQKVFGIAFSIVGVLPSIASVSPLGFIHNVIHRSITAQSCSTPFLMAVRSRWSGG